MARCKYKQITFLKPRTELGHEKSQNIKLKSNEHQSSQYFTFQPKMLKIVQILQHEKDASSWIRPKTNSKPALDDHFSKHVL